MWNSKDYGDLLLTGVSVYKNAHSVIGNNESEARDDAKWPKSKAVEVCLQLGPERGF